MSEKLNEEEMDLENILIENALIDDLFYYRDLKDRKIYFNEVIDDDNVFPVIRNIMNINKQDDGIPVEDRKPIMMYISTPGGDVESGLSLIDAIMASKTPVYTINIGDNYSMGFLIGLAGHKRFTFKNSRFLLHDGFECIYDSASKAEDRKKFTNELDNRLKSYVLSRTKITAQKYARNRRKEWYMFAEQAKELGVVDYIVGEDVEMEDIL